MSDAPLARLMQLWRWLVEDHLFCDTCASELATSRIEKDAGRAFTPNDLRCAKRSRHGSTCIEWFKATRAWEKKPAPPSPLEQGPA